LAQKQYTVKNNQTGQTVTFAWHDPTPPTEADIEEVFAEAARSAAPQDSPYGEVFPDYGAAGKKMANEVGTAIKENPGTTGALVAGLAAAPFTGGMSVLPMMAFEGAAAGAGHLAGEGISAAVSDRPVPENLAGNVAKEALFSGLTAGIGPAAKALGRGFYHTALRPSLTLAQTPDDVAKLVTTGLEEGIGVSTRGYRKAENLIAGLDADVTKLISDLNTVVDPQKGFDKIATLRSTYQRRGAPQAKLDALDALEANYRQRYASPMRAEEMHELKKGIWHETGPSFNRELNTGTTEGMRKFGEGLRETIEDAGKRQGVDTIADKNARMGSLIELKEQIERSAAHYPTAGLRQAVEVAAGSNAPSIIQRAIATSAPVLAGTGRFLHNVVGKLDPRGLRPASSHPPIGGKPKQTPVSLDTVGVDEVPGAKWEPDPLDKIGVPVSRGAREAEDAWAAKFAPEPVISHRKEYPPVRNLYPVYAKQTSLDELGIPAGAGPAESPTSLDALDIPANRELRNSEELWLQRLLEKEHPELAKLPRREQIRFIEEKLRSGGHRSAERNTPASRITKDRIETLYRRYLTSK
jgi:hypothetical protein